LSTIVFGRDGIQPADLLLVDLPLGAIDLNKGTQVSALNIQAPGWFVVPIAREKAADLSESPPPINLTDGAPLSVTISIEEADDLGDVIKKGAEKMGENKSKIVEVILERTGLQKK
jgi:hypothetical protein